MELSARLGVSVAEADIHFDVAVELPQDPLTAARV